MRDFIRICAVWALVGLGTVTIAQDQAAAPMVIYDTALASGWQNWSWAKTELGIEIPGSARKPIKVEAAGWQALYLQHEAFSTTGYQNVEFLIQGTAPEAEVRVIALIDGKPANDGRTIKVGNKGWTRVVTPLRTLGVEDKSIDGLWVQNASANDLPKFYVTEIKLL